VLYLHISPLQRQTALGARAYSTDKPKSSGNGLLFAALAGLGVAGGIYYNSSSTTSVKPAAAAKPAEAPAATELKAAFSPKEFKAFKVSTPANRQTNLKGRIKMSYICVIAQRSPRHQP
jgi:hypothetical protein